MNKKPEKFFFNQHNFDQGIFDAAAEKRREEEERLAEEQRLAEELPPPPPSFSEEELNAAKQRGFDEGKTQGISEEKARQDALKQQTLENIARTLPALLDQESERNRHYEIETLRLTEAILKKLFPLFSARHGLQELTNALEQILKQKAQNNPQNIEIFINPDQAIAIEEEIKALTLGESIHLTPSDKITSGNCQIRWKDGGADYSPNTISDEIYALLEKEIEENAIKSTTDPIEDSPEAKECATIDADNEIKPAQTPQDVPANEAETPDDGDTQ